MCSKFSTLKPPTDWMFSFHFHKCPSMLSIVPGPFHSPQSINKFRMLLISTVNGRHWKLNNYSGGYHNFLWTWQHVLYFAVSMILTVFYIWRICRLERLFNMFLIPHHSHQLLRKRNWNLNIGCWDAKISTLSYRSSMIPLRTSMGFKYNSMR